MSDHRNDIWKSADELEAEAVDMAKLAEMYRNAINDFWPHSIVTRRRAICTCQNRAAHLFRKAQEKRTR